MHPMAINHMFISLITRMNNNVKDVKLDSQVKKNYITGTETVISSYLL